ncbi:winged helix-turn-helix domain-containing protein [Halorhabdus sp. BNX81]|uniref:ArsR/SmtB family transcription factor n=1 Tax=Halorhabdus sp. BNX81 TaxID=2980181 RepID=UPI0023DD3AF1|nr:winged helix-turn-helix domain-containing protein [Halorhabdus sp. BNX81]WEL22801.1 Transcriptional regulator containing HTH domain,ArsR family [Halorhabdus sp. BNX81]
MSSEPLRPRVGPDAPAGTPSATDRNDEWHHDDPTALLEALGDEYTRAAVEAVLDQPRSGREVAAATDMSRPTAFRRLNALVDLGMLETEHRIDAAEGHHHKVYRPVVDSVAVTFDDGEITVVLESARPSGPHVEQSTPVPAND